MIANIKRYAMRNINLNPMAQQTAVEWLAERVVIPSENGKYHIEVPYGDGKIDVTSIIKQAKQMEKEQRIQDYNAGYTAYISWIYTVLCLQYKPNIWVKGY